MQSINILRNTIQNLANRSLGIRKGSPRYFSGQKLTETFSNTVFSLPAVPVDPIQDLNTESATYGKFYFMAGYDPVGDDDKPIAP